MYVCMYECSFVGVQFSWVAMKEGIHAHAITSTPTSDSQRGVIIFRNYRHFLRRTSFADDLSKHKTTAGCKVSQVALL